MQTKFKDGSVMVCGGCSKDAELRHVGEKATPRCTVGVAVGKRQNAYGEEETVWCNVVAWRAAAEALAGARKGTPVLVIGRLEEREYEGKTYRDLVADYVSVCTPAAHSAPPAPAADRAAQDLRELDGEDDELPF